ncbi:transcriptional regulator, TetR family [Kribbella flavida DSM 17836]|uniref:Transcriptional regulator, TetR family n=1 Tax=Kribbella flavida (strain DSM 17836 / JCM 10339 / NBRC 14399) TaxID=479435 RepID=D2PSE0_KRIFD|nr:TetR/AcrR family transcriptional regulator [Kribbella flavida]ADB33078.1 transcriptional regulator, TetR family [Kribbella flavida DSM 17836]
MEPQGPRQPDGGTRERLLAAGLRLFAERGFDAVRVGDIEQAAGLVPRRGAMYRHFKSKEALLAAAVESHLVSVAEARAQYAGDSERFVASAEQLGAFVLAEMDRQQLITHVLERDGNRLVELRDRFRQDVSDAGYRAMTEVVRAWLSSTRPAVDARLADAVAVHLLGAMINARRSTWTLGAPPFGLTDAELVTAWAALCEGWVAGQSATDTA